MTEPLMDFERGGYRFIVSDESPAKVTITKGGQVVREFEFPAYKIWNIPAHAEDIVDGLEQESDAGLRIAGSDGLEGNAYASEPPAEEEGT